MEINRNQYFAIGVVVLLLGIQFRYVESFTLNKDTSTLIRKRLSKKKTPALVANNSSFSDYFGTRPVLQSNIKLTPPKWIGWALLSTGGVLVLHSLAVPKPE